MKYVMAISSRVPIRRHLRCVCANAFSKFFVFLKNSIMQFSDFPGVVSEFADGGRRDCVLFRPMRSRQFRLRVLLYCCRSFTLFYFYGGFLLWTFFAYGASRCPRVTRCPSICMFLVSCDLPRHDARVFALPIVSEVFRLRRYCDVSLFTLIFCVLSSRISF